MCLLAVVWSAIARLAPRNLVEWLPGWLVFGLSTLLWLAVYRAISAMAKPLSTWICRLAGVSQESYERQVIRRGSGMARAPYLGAPPDFGCRGLSSSVPFLSREGVEGTPDGQEPRLIPWRDVESCTITKERDVEGNFRITILFEGRQGHLLRLSAAFDYAVPEMMAVIGFYLRGEEGQAVAPQVLGGS